MASRPIGSPNRARPLIQIETDAFTLLIRGKPFHPTAVGLGFRDSQTPSQATSTLKVDSDFDSDSHMLKILVYLPESDQLVQYEGHCRYPLFYENQDYYLTIRSKGNAGVSFYHESHIIREAIHREFPDLLSGHINFRNEVGFTELVVRVNQTTAINIQLEVFPAKMDYRTDFNDILRGVEEQVYNLAYSFLTRTFQGMSPVKNTNPSLTEFFSLFRSAFDDLTAAISRVERFPHHGLTHESRMLPASRARLSARDGARYLQKHPNMLAHNGRGFIIVDGQRYEPIRLPSTRQVVHINTHENKFVRWMLERIVRKLTSVQDAYSRLDRKPDLAVLDFLKMAENRVRATIERGVLREVDSTHNMTVTLALQLSPGYREIYQIYLLIWKGLQVGSNLFRLSLKDLAALYEYWCFLQLHTLLKQRFQLISDDVVRVHRDGLFATLNKSKAAAFVYKNPATGERISLVYNTLPQHVKTPLPTVPQRPDTVLTIQREGKRHKYSYIFDAKYRLNPALPGTDYATRYGSIPGPEEEDINTMHRYRDAIVHTDALGRYQRSMYGAYVLFPYADEAKYEGHQLYKSITSVNIGGLPFLPGATRLVERLLDNVLETEPRQESDTGLHA